MNTILTACKTCANLTKFNEETSPCKGCVYSHPELEDRYSYSSLQMIKSFLSDREISYLDKEIENDYATYFSPQEPGVVISAALQAGVKRLRPEDKTWKNLVAILVDAGVLGNE